MAINFNPTVAAGEGSRAAGITPGGVSDSNRRVAGQTLAPEYTTELSSSSDSVESLTRSAVATSAGRADRVATLKQAVSSNQYALDPVEIADALVTSDF